MFFQILKKDLKRKKTLNLTILIFIILAAMLASTGVKEIYSTLTGLEYTKKVSRIPDYMIFQDLKLSEKEEYEQSVRDWAKQSELVRSMSIESYIEYDYHNVSFMNQEEVSANLKRKRLLFTKYPKEYNFVYDLMDQPFRVKDREIAISSELHYVTNAKVGDKIQLCTYRGDTYEFTISHIFKDTLFPSSYTSRCRLIVSDGDYEQLRTENMLDTTWYNFEVSSASARNTFIPNYPFGFQEYMDNVSWNSAYDLQMTICIMLMIVSGFLIIIVFVTLRFTILSSVQEDYQEIGMMKAIGIPNMHFKLLYQAKYTMLAIVGTAIGYLISIPCSNYLKEAYNTSLILPSGQIEIVYAMLSCFLIVVCIILFSYLALRKTNHMTVVDAIRNGNTGERFRSFTAMDLFHRRRMGMPLHLGITSLLKESRRYIFLFITFLIGTGILLLPFHVIHTITSPSYLKYFEVLDSDFLPYDTTGPEEEYASTRAAGEVATYEGFQKWFCEQLSTDEFPIQLKKSKQVHYDYVLDEDHLVDVCAMFGLDASLFEYEKGVAPKLANEIAVTACFAEKYNVSLGSVIRLYICHYNEEKTDTIREEKEFVITGIYESMTNNGIGIRMGTEYDQDYCWQEIIHAIRFGGNHTKEEREQRIKELIQVYGDQTICTPERYQELSMDRYIYLFRYLKLLLCAIVLGLLFLMTYLFEDIILSKEAGDIAIFQSIGIGKSRIVQWQCIRMILLSVPAILLGIVTSVVVGEKICNIVFRGYGITRLKFLIDRRITYVISPLCIIGVIILAVLIACVRVKKMNFQNIKEG